MASHALNDIFEKLHSTDKDYRFMATSDLYTELQKDVRMDSDTERKICKVVLQKMHDQAGEISEIAIKCFGVLLPKVGDHNLLEMLKTLTDSFLNEKKEHEGREMANIGLKTAIENIPSHSNSSITVVRCLAPSLIKGMETKNDEIVLMSLDIAREFVMKYGTALDGNGEPLLRILLNLLNQQRSVVRKKAIACIGVLSLSLSDAQLSDLLTALIGHIDGEVSKQLVIASIQAVGVVGFVVGSRAGSFVPVALPRLMSHISNASEDDVEMLESCIRSFESFVGRCSVFAQPFLNDIVDVCLHYLKFDPNYADDAEDSDRMSIPEEEDEDDMYSEEEAYSDDEDESWKVRKACASCLTVIFSKNVDQIHKIYVKVGPVLIVRFSEREENVRLDVLGAYMSLLSHIRRHIKSYGDIDASSLLEDSVPALMRAIGRQLRDKSVKTRLQTFRVLKEISLVLPDQIVHHIDNFVPPITKALQEGSGTTSELKIEVLSFLRASMIKSKATDMRSTLSHIAQSVFDSVGERYYKVTSEALRVCNAMVAVIRPFQDTIIDDQLSILIPSLYDVVHRRLSAQDVDQEVKEVAIKCMADIVASLGDTISDRIQEVFRILLERVRNETTRLTAVKALGVVAASKLNLDLTDMTEVTMTELTVFLRKANVNLRQAALDALDIFCKRPGIELGGNVIEGIIQEASLLVSDHDLHLASKSLDLLCTVARVVPSSKHRIEELVVPASLELVQSPLLQGTALISLQNFFVSMFDHFDRLFPALIKEIPGKVQQLSTAKCIAAMSVERDPSTLPETLQILMGLTDRSGAEAMHRLALLSLGEIGRLTSLSDAPRVEQLLVKFLEHPSEDVKTAACYALGALSLGNLPYYLPGLVRKIQSNRGQQRQLYLLLMSLDEILTSLNREGKLQALTQDHVVAIRDMLLSSQDFEEDCRNVAAECLGQLALLQPDVVLPSLRSCIDSPSEDVRCRIVSGIRYAIVDQPHDIDVMLQGTLPVYLQTLTDTNRHVRKAAVQLLSATLAHKYRLVQESLLDVLPQLYQQTIKRDDLIRVLELGPFKHRIDDGIELRKATFECMHLLLDVALPRLHVQEFLKHVEKGLGDENDIKLLCYPMVIKLCTASPTEVVSELDRIVEPLRRTLTRNTSADAVKHEKERHQELILSCLRVIDALTQIEGISSQRSLKLLLDSVINRGEMKTTFQHVQKERKQEQEEQKVNQDSANLFSIGRGMSSSMSL